MSCPTCGCQMHIAARTWEVRCTVCRELRWPYAVTRPDAYVCQRCAAVPPEVRAIRVAAAAKRGALRLAKAPGEGTGSAGPRSDPEAG